MNFIISDDDSCNDEFKIMADHSTEVYVYDIPQHLGGSPSVPQGQGSLQPEDITREKKIILEKKGISQHEKRTAKLSERSPKLLWFVIKMIMLHSLAKLCLHFSKCTRSGKKLLHRCECTIHRRKEFVTKVCVRG